MKPWSTQLYIFLISSIIVLERNIQFPMKAQATTVGAWNKTAVIYMLYLWVPLSISRMYNSSCVLFVGSRCYNIRLTELYSLLAVAMMQENKSILLYYFILFLSLLLYFSLHLLNIYYFLIYVPKRNIYINTKWKE